MNIYKIIFIIIVILNCIVFSIYLAVKVIDKIYNNESNTSLMTNNNDIETIKLRDNSSSDDSNIDFNGTNIDEDEEFYQIEDDEYIPIKTKD